MARKTLALRELVNLDLGKIDAAWAQAREEAARDILDRPHDKTKRKVVLSMNLEPEEVISNGVESVLVSFQVETKVPKRTSKSYSMAVDHKGSMVFNDESPDNSKQMTLDEVASDAGD